MCFSFGDSPNDQGSDDEDMSGDNGHANGSDDDDENMSEVEEESITQPRIRVNYIYVKKAKTFEEE